MRLATPRRAAFAALATVLSSQPLLPITAAGDRSVAQSIGIDQKSAALGDLTFVWGGAKRCDPTDPTCLQGGNELVASGAGIASVPTSSIDERQITERLSFDINIANEAVGSLALGLCRPCAPGAVDAFVKLSRGQYISAEGEDPASYERSVAVKSVRDRYFVMGALKRQGGSTQIVAGVTKPQRFPCQPPKTADPPNGISHDAAGLISVRRSGGTFEFALTTRPCPELDKDNIVIGRLLDGSSMELLERLNVLPTNNYNSGPLATVQVRAIRAS